MLRTLIVVLALAVAAGSAAAADKPALRFGLTAVVVKENLRFLDRFAQYLTAKLEAKVRFVRRRSYREVMDLLESGGLEFAWICGYPFVQKREPEILELLAVPVYRQEPLYHSFFIVNSDSPYQSLDDLKGRVFAFSDPDSNSGFLYPQATLARRGETPGSFFRQTFFTFNHAETVEAVAEQVADGGAVDSYIWEYLQKFKPEVASRTRVIHRSPKFGFPPLVAHLGVDRQTVDRMSRTLVGMARDAEGRKLLSGLMLDGFGAFPSDLFDDIRDMAGEVKKAKPWLAKGDR